MLTLSGNNAYTGGTTISAGEFSISASNNLPAGCPVVFSGGILQITGTAVSGLGKLLGQLVHVQWRLRRGELANVFTVSDSIGGGGRLSKFGRGTLLSTGRTLHGQPDALPAANLASPPAIISAPPAARWFFKGGILQIGASRQRPGNLSVNWPTGR